MLLVAEFVNNSVVIYIRSKPLLHIYYLLIVSGRPFKKGRLADWYN